ncbi:MAG: UDP-glucose 4-epimerase [Chloroflexi bacterium ADurb.Bin360]|nr:MAG: UDP-glucose 4-epimerase [Chloroflexi bacterium ADurb.Bin360]
MRVLVTGAAGFIGSHLAERLAALGHAVVGLDCLTDYYDRAQKERNAAALAACGIPLLRLDLASDDLHAALEGTHILYHLAAQPGISAATPFEIYLRNNIIATQRLLAAAQTLPTLRMAINIATSSIYGADATGDETTEPRPTSHYGVTKLAAEQLLLARYRDTGFPACSLRLFSVYGPRERPETYVADAVDGMVAVLEHLDACNGEIFNIGTDQTLTTGEGIQIVERILGQPARIVRQPRRSGDQLRTHANIAKARRLLEVAWIKGIMGRENVAT